MLRVLAWNWWLIALRGLVAVLFGAAAYAWPGLTLLALVAIFGAYALVDGVAAIVAAVKGAGSGSRWWVLLVEGVIGVAAGVWTLAAPGLAALALLYVIAGWALVTGALEVAAAIRLRREIEGEWMLALDGLLSVLFGLYVAAFPGAGALAIAWIIGVFAFVTGVLLIALGLRLRGAADAEVGRAAPSAATPA